MANGATHRQYSYAVHLSPSNIQGMTARPMQVAILDDDPSIRAALGRLLKAAGMVAHPHATSDQLFEAIAGQRPDCLLLDLQMPGMSGLDVLKYLGQRQIRIPTIIITGHDEVASRSACLDAGAVAYLSKPLDADQLIQTIEKVFGGKISGPPQPGASPSTA